MKTLNIFIENIYPEFEIEEVEILSKLKKMTEFFLRNDELIAKSCLSGYDFESLSFDVVFCTNDKIREINRDYRGKDVPTDVITFAIFADSELCERFIIDEDISLGEIIVSLDRIKEQAEENKNTFEKELCYILSHGVLHSLGFDHLTQEDYHYMVEEQNKALKAVSVD